MKILIIANRKKWKSWDKKTQQLKDWFHPVIDMDFTIEHVKIKGIPFESYGVFDGKERSGVSKSWYQENIVSKYPGYDRYILSMNRKDWKAFPVEGWQWDGNCIAIASDEKGEYNFKGVKYDGGKWFNLARHELCHAEYVQRSILDRTHEHWDSGDLSKVLLDFKQLVMTTTQKYKYFKESEIKGLQPELVSLLDKCREEAGVPFSITSGFRTSEENAALPDAVPDSAHLDGLAVDIKCLDSSSRWKIVNAAIKVGFKRIGIGNKFVHLDVDLLKPQNCIWHYY